MSPITQLLPLDLVKSYQNPISCGVLSPKFYVDVPAGPQKFDFLYTKFSHNYPLMSIPFLKGKHTILIKLGAFYYNLLKIHPIYAIWALSSLMKTHRLLNFVLFLPKYYINLVLINMPLMSVSHDDIDITMVQQRKFI